MDKFELICVECCHLLKTAYMFKELCIRSNILLQGCLFRSKSDVEFKECITNNFAHNNVKSETDIKQEEEESNNEQQGKDSEDDDDSFEHTEASNGASSLDIEDSPQKLPKPAVLKIKRSGKTPAHTDSFTCFICDENFMDQTTLDQHVLDFNHKSNKYICYYCERGFTRKTYLKKHLFIHTGIRPFTCNICQMTFNRKNTLETHMLIHEGVKNHNCPTCGKSFRLKCALDRHTLIHSNYKAHKCSVCDKRFGRKDHLEKHSKVHRNS